MKSEDGLRLCRTIEQCLGENLALVRTYMITPSVERILATHIPTRIHSLRQALAAIMNDSMPGGTNLDAWLSSHGITESIDEILTNATIEEIRNLGSVLAGYNESGDDQALDPSLPATGKTTGNIADPQGARDVGAGCEQFWNTPPAPKGKGKK